MGHLHVRSHEKIILLSLAKVHKLGLSILSSFILSATIPVVAQTIHSEHEIQKHKNLLANPSFEEYIDCPRRIDATGILTIVEGWYQPTGGSADYFNACGNRECGVPDNKLGRQEPHSGEGYCGIYCSKTEYREYLQTELSEPLRAGIVYEIEFYVSLSEYSTGAVATIGALLTPNRISDSSRSLLMQQEQRTIGRRITQTFLTEYHPQVVNPYDSLLLDTDRWMRIHGTFTAEGGERFLTIGNFATADHSNLVYPEGLTYTLPGAYYYIDDVSIRPITEALSPVETSDSLSDRNTLSSLATKETTRLESGAESPINEPLKVNRSFVLKEIYFDLDKSLLLQQSYQELARLQDLLNSHPTMRIEIIGHTDNQGSEAYNQRLSEERAKAVVDYLIRKGINPRRLTYHGKGKSQPLFPNDSEEHRAQNRRVEFRIVAL